MTTILALCVVLCVYLAGKALTWAAKCVSARKTARMVHVNEAWRQATCITIHYGVQHTLAQEDRMIGELYDELCIPTGWTDEEIEEIEASLGGDKDRVAYL